MSSLKKIILKLNIFQKLSLKVKLWALVSLMFAVICTVGFIGYSSTRIITQDVYSMYKSTASVNYLVEINQSRLEMVQYLWAAYSDYHPSGKISESAIKDISDSSTNLSNKINDYGVQTSGDVKESESYNKIKNTWEPIKKDVENIIQKFKDAKDQRVDILKQVNEISDKALTLSDNISESMGIIKQKALDSYTNTQQIEKRSNIIYISIGISALMLTLLCFYIVSQLVRSLLQMTDALSSSSSQVSSASQQLSNTSDQLSTDAQSQATALEEASASITEITSMAESNTRNANQVEDHAKTVLEASQTLQSSMTELANAMTSIMDSNNKIEALKILIEDISNKTQIIDDIVFKTQLLSFNASVEAERAGEHGRGFSVVAQEVGNLAQVSGKAATEISSIVKSSIKETENVSADNKGRVETGGQLVNETKQRLEKVTASMAEIIEMISKISQASREQSVGIKQVADSIESLNQTTQKTAHTAQDSAGASTELSGQAGELSKVVNDLEGVVYGRIKGLE